MKSILAALQFFTSVPIRKNIDLDKRTVTAMFLLFPVIGALVGGITASVAMLLEEASFSAFFSAVVLVIVGVVITGGLHIDGWADTWDGYFSYREPKRRLEILEDSRVGAFGVIGIVLLLLLKTAIYYEIVHNNSDAIIYFITIPVLARITMVHYFVRTKSAKVLGMAYFFQQQLYEKTVRTGFWIWSGVCVVLLWVVTKEWLLPMSILFIIVSIIFLYKKWTEHHFDGVTGDLNGALVEGTELLLWIIVLLYI